jgi:hypothetical protein
MPLRRLLALAAAAVAAAAEARADFQITIGDATVSAGSATSVLVTISGGPDDRLDTFGVEFRLTPVNNPAGFVRFSATQSNAQLSAPNYVFAGDSAGGTGVATTTTFTRDTYIGGDGTLSMAGVPVTPSNDLLVLLDVSALDAAAGDRFTISLVPTANTFFFDALFNPVQFASTSGTVTVTPVPEPAGLVAAAAGLLAATRLVRRRTTDRP